MNTGGDPFSSPSLAQLLTSDLKLESCQWEKRIEPVSDTNQDSGCLEVNALVHNDWLDGVTEGHVLGPQPPPIPQEEIHWLLQPSCESVLPQPWQRVHLVCLCKSPNASNSSRRTLVPQLNNFSMDSIHDFFTQIAQESQLLSWKEIMYQLHHPPQHLSTRTPITSAFVHEVVQKLYHVQVHSIEGEENRKATKARPKGSSNSDDEDAVHPNLSPLLAALESRHAFYFVYPYLRFTLFDSAMHSPAMLEDSIAKPLFVLYQLLNLLNHCHSNGTTLGDLGLKNVFVDARLWVQIRLPLDTFLTHATQASHTPHSSSSKAKEVMTSTSQPSGSVLTGTNETAGLDVLQDSLDDHVTPSSTPIGSLHPSQAGSTNTLTGIVEVEEPASCTVTLPSNMQLPEVTHKWRSGELSNFDYLMLLNHHAGRVVGDPNNHPIFPWVIDFTHKDGGYRDLSKSKYRLNKGDRQLDFTFITAQEEQRRGPEQESLVPHHIGDISSDVTYYVYLARKTPKEVLCSRVRPQWVPKEYPSSLEKMYIWTPDECIPEFYTDPEIFKSIHPDLPDLAVPEWASSPEELVKIHRTVLEGDVVSAHLHHWIDLMFGFKLSGHDAIRAKNVYVSLVDKHKDPKNCGIVQLFKSSHPKRIQSTSAPLAIFSWNAYLNMSSMMSGTNFPINQPPLPTMSSRSGPQGRRFTSPEPDDSKTLESIIIEQAVSQQNPLHDDGTPGELAQDEDLTGSFEHVNMDDVKEKMHATNPSPGLPNGDIGINYEEPTTVSSAEVKLQPPTKPRGESVVAMPTPSNRFKMPVVNMIFNRQKHKGGAQEAEGTYDWQHDFVAFPREANILHRLNKLEEMAHFAFKSCKDDGELYKEQWKAEDFQMFDSSSDVPFHPVVRVLQLFERSPCYLPSFDERVALDVAAVTCTMIELCCVKQLRATLPASATLLQRIIAIRKLLGAGRLRIPSYLSYLADIVLCPDQPGGLPSSPSDLKLPSLTSSLLLQPFLPFVMFPSYFQTLYKFLFHLEQLCLKHGMDYLSMSLEKPTFLGLQLKKSPDKDFDKIFSYISEKLDSLLELVTDEGFPLLLMHLFPFFQYPDTSFEAVYAFLPLLAKSMSRGSVENVFTPVVTKLFDTATEPHHRGQLFSRTTADLILKRFGLSTFLNRFLSFLIEAVVEPLRASSNSKRINSNIVRMRSQSVLTLMSADLLQSQVYDHVDTDGRDMDTNLPYNLAMSEDDYGSDKESSSSDSEDEFAESSLLAKSTVLGAEREIEGMSLSPLILASQPSAPKVPTSDSNPQESQATGVVVELPGNQDEGMVAGEPTIKINLAPDEPPPPPPYSLMNAMPQQQQGEQGLLSSYQDSLTGSSQFDPTQSIGSQYSEDTFASNVLFTSSLKTTPSRHLKMGGGDKISKQHSLPFGMKFNVSNLSNGFAENFVRDASEEREECEAVEEEANTTFDPQALAINLHVSEVAADCLSWLLRRLGPLLASQHIIRPLLENVYRCFSGVLELKGKEVAALRCLSSFAECYGETVVRKMYFPHAENFVASATNRMTAKTEAGLAASLGLIKVSIKALSVNSLQESAQEICDRYFLPLIQLLSSQATLPSGGKARAAICQSMVKLLVSLGEMLGRDSACDLLGPTVECFFASFSGIHQDLVKDKVPGGHSGSNDSASEGDGEKDGMDGVHGSKEHSSPLTSSMKQPGSSSRPEAKTVEFHPLTESQKEPQASENAGSVMDSEAYKQLCTTFSKAMAHLAYVDFCKLLGQHYVQKTLCNAELIEQIAYSHDEMSKPASPLSSILTETLHADSDTNSDTSSDGESDDEVGITRDAALKVGPIAAVTGLNMEESGFRKSSWFVDLDEKEDTANKEGRTSPHKQVAKSNIEQNVATFDAKFSTVTTSETTAVAAAATVPASGRGIGVGAAPSISQSVVEQDFTLLGAWKDLWENHLHEPVYQRDGFHHFRGGKLQTYTGASGHKGAVKCLALSDGEHFFVSGSKDKTAKIWSLRNQGKASGSVGCQLTYGGHQKPVVAVELLERIDTVASCDGTLQLWDPETGYTLHQFTSPRSSSFVTMRSLVSSQSVLVAATADLNLRFIDLRTKSFLHLWKLQFPTGGAVKSVACADNWISIGNQNGAINTLDVRTGELLSLWKPADSANVQSTTWNENLFQMKATVRGNLVTSVGSGLLSLWRPSHGKLLYHLKGQNHTTPCLEVVGEQLISVAGNGNLVIHTSFESSRDCHHVSLRASKRNVASMAALKENKLLLLGHENGQIALMA